MKNILILASVLFLASCVSNNNKDELPVPLPEETVASTFPPLSYTTHTKNYFDNYCTSCHAPGLSQAFFPLTTFNEVSVYTGTNGKIKTRVLIQGNMPPSGSVTGDLTTAEKDTLQEWLLQGAPN